MIILKEVLFSFKYGLVASVQYGEHFVIITHIEENMDEDGKITKLPFLPKD